MNPDPDRAANNVIGVVCLVLFVCAGIAFWLLTR